MPKSMYIPVKDRIYHVKTQGCVVINGIDTITESKNIIAIEIDLKTKWAETNGIVNSKELYLGSGERTWKLHKTKTGETLISFPKYPDFDIFMAQVSRYTLKVCLKKRQIV